MAGGMLVACGGGGKPAPAPTLRTSTAPVSVRVQAIGSFAPKNADGLVALRVYTDGPHAASAKVVLAFDVPTGKKLAVRYEPAQKGGMDMDQWPPLTLSSSPGPKPGLDTLTGSYSVPLHGGDLWRFVLQPQYGPSSASETVPVRVSLAAGGARATGTADATLATITGAWDDATTPGGKLHRDGRWTEADVVVSNVSTRNLAPVYAGLQITDCSRNGAGMCDPGTRLLDDFVLQTYDGHGWVSAPPSNGMARRVLDTSLKPGAEAKVRVRFAPTADLGKGVAKVEVRLACVGTMSGAKASLCDNVAREYDVT